MNQLNKFLWLTILTFTQCNQATERCETYECRRQNIEILIENSILIVEEATQLVVHRKEIYLPKLRVFIGDYDDKFEPVNSDELQYFEGSDSTASVTLIFESSGEKIVRGIIEEYILISEDSTEQVIESFTYPLELTVNVSEHPDSLKISI